MRLSPNPTSVSPIEADNSQFLFNCFILVSLNDQTVNQTEGSGASNRDNTKDENAFIFGLTAVPFYFNHTTS